MRFPFAGFRKLRVPLAAKGARADAAAPGSHRLEGLTLLFGKS